MISKHARRIEVFTLDTGRLPNETYDLLDTVRDTYKRSDFESIFRTPNRSRNGWN
jgi:3'-phosphoadenosine 5'-phosphosulfate sulfotransferase (PAPS reductase)/FAD synthetase